MRKPIPMIQRFWAKVDKTDTCWLWCGSSDGTDGYGRLRVGGKTRKRCTVHRFSWEVHFGPIPDGLKVLHKCDVPGCVRPDHLFLGTAADNSADMVNKRRQAFGEKNRACKHDYMKVVQIRADYYQQARSIVSILALKHGVEESYVREVLRCRSRLLG